MSFSLILSSNSSDFTTVFNSIVLQPPYEYESCLLSVDTYNSIPNILEGKNNLFKYFNGNQWKMIYLKTGAYELHVINMEIKQQMNLNADQADLVKISAEISTLRSIVNIYERTGPNQYKVSFEEDTNWQPVTFHAWYTFSRIQYVTKHCRYYANKYHSRQYRHNTRFAPKVLIIAE